MFSHPYRYLFIVLLAGYSLVNTWLVETLVHYPIEVSNEILLAVFLVLCFAIWEGNRLLENYILTKKFEHLWLRILSIFGGSLVMTTLLTMILGLSVAYFILPFNLLSLLLPMKLLMMFAFRINLFLNVLNIIFLYVKQLEKTQSEVEQFKKISVQAQLQAVRNQINPHFLFNNLSVLSAMIPTDTDSSIEFVRQFSKVYRYVLKSHEKELVEVGDELDFIDSYFYLMQKRFGSSLSVNIDVSDNLRNDYIVPVALQMLVENAVKHNIVSKSRPLRIDIFNEDNKYLIVQNNLQVKDVIREHSTQVGLQNIMQRYEFFGKNTVKVIATDHFFMVKIPLLQLSHSVEESILKVAQVA
jgi:two-component system, LytTR family, sensor kinase